MLACRQLETPPAANVLEKNATSNADLDQLGATALIHRETRLNICVAGESRQRARPSNVNSSAVARAYRSECDDIDMCYLREAGHGNPSSAVAGTGVTYMAYYVTELAVPCRCRTCFVTSFICCRESNLGNQTSHSLTKYYSLSGFAF